MALLTLLTDATLLSETVECMSDHHCKAYPRTTTDPALRPQEIALLWIMNVMWLVAPLLTMLWAWQPLDVRQDLSASSRPNLKGGKWKETFESAP